MQEINVNSLKELLATSNEDFLLIDVREFFEHEVENIGGICMPLSELNNYIPQLPTKGTVVVYCRKGVRSQIAIQRLQDKLPAVQFINVTGGIEAFKKVL